MQLSPLLISAMMMVESGGYAGAIGDGGRALGVLQIHAVVIEDVNRYHHTAYKHTDALDTQKAIRICRLYLSMHAPHGATPEQIARIWNGGPRGHEKAATTAYWNKVQPVFERLNNQRHKMLGRRVA